MNSQSKDTGRLASASERARRSFEQTRDYFGGAGDNPYLKQAGDRTRRGWHWVADRTPGGQRTLWIVVGLILLILFVWAIIPGSKTDLPPGGLGGPQPVGVATAVKGDIDIWLNGQGTVTPLATVTVRPQVSGQIVRIALQEGQNVKAGDLLAEIDPRSFQAALDQAKGQLARDSASLANARLDLKRDQALYAAKAVSQQVLDTQAALVKQDEGVVLSDNANVESARINLGYTRITSPIAGRVGIRLVDVGNFVSAGQTTGIVVVTQLQPMSVLFSQPEDNIGDIVARIGAGAVLTADAYDRAQITKLASGKLTAVDTQIDPTTGTVKLRALFDNADESLFPNQFVNIRLLVNTLHNQTVVPAAAVQRGAEGTFVFVVKPDHTVAIRTVVTGKQQDERVSIVKGLNVGETVVTDGGDRLRDGGPITIPSGQKVDATVAPAENATAIPETAQSGRRAAMMALMRKLTPDECTKTRAMSRDDRTAWMKDHREELLKRPDDPSGGCKFGGGGSGGSFRMRGGGPPG
ncbi:MAG: MdtA/MuxA family multidrug efflux RND transporter periplasmic adaptor subunit [Rhizomicrobium sp.]